MTGTTAARGPRRRSPWPARVLVIIAMVLLASLPPYLDSAPADLQPSAGNPIYGWAKSTRLFW